MKSRGSINVYTKWQKTAAKDYSYYFHEALERISFIEMNFYKSLAEIEVIDRSILLVNWPEEILAWSIGKSNAQEAIHNLRKLKKDGLRILYVWHNTEALHDSEGKRLLYNWFKNNSNFILCLNSRTLKHCTDNGIKSAISLAPFMCNDYPSVGAEGLLVYGRLRHRSEFLRLLLAAWTAHLHRREVFVGSLPTDNARVQFTRLLINLLPNAPNIHLHTGFLEGDVESYFWEKSKTVITFRDTKHENSGILINALSEKRRIIIGNCGSAHDYEHLKVVTSYKTIFGLMRAIRKDSKTAYDSADFERPDYIHIKAQSSTLKFKEALENGLAQVLSNSVKKMSIK